MTAPLWLPGATVVAATTDGGSMTGSDAYVTWHTFECDYTVKAVVGARALNVAGNSVHLCFNPVTGEVAQMLPADRAGRGLQNLAGGVETNRQGRVNIQIEVIGRASRPWTQDLTAAGRATLATIIGWLDQLGVPRSAPNGFIGPTTYAASTSRARSLTAWGGPGGYFCHADVPENTHWDHGAIDIRDLWAATTPAAPSEEDQLMAITVTNPVTKEEWPLERALWSIWSYAIQGAGDQVDEPALAKALLPLISDPLKAAVVDAVQSSSTATPEQIADKVLAGLGAALQPKTA